MSEDYQDMLSSLGTELSEQSGNPVVDEDKLATDVESTDKEVESSNDTTESEQTETTEVTPEETYKQQRANEAFAAMRSENSKYKQFIQQMMKGVNFQGDEATFIQNMTDAAYQRQAQNQGNQVSPELLKRMDNMESQNRALIEERNKNMFASNLRNLQDTFKLNDNDIREFIDKAVAENIDLTIPNTNFVTLYQGLFFEKLRDRMLKEERQKWIEQSSKSSNAANPDGKSGKTNTDPTEINTMAEFESLLKSVPK